MIVDSAKRTFIKAIGWRFLALLVTFCTTLTIFPFIDALISAAIAVAVADGMIKLFMYYVYDRLWDRIKYGRLLVKKTGCCLWMTGLSGSGKTTIAKELVKKLESKLVRVEYLDGDIVRQSLCKDLGFTKADRDENIRRISYMGSYLSNHAVVICAFISPYREARGKARDMCNNFYEVFIDAPLEVCEDRDVKGLYAKARAGEIKGFTGIDDPYEEPLNPELHIKTDEASVEECADKIIAYLAEHNIL